MSTTSDVNNDTDKTSGGPAELAEKFQFENSDIALVSSDDVTFKVHSYQLMAAR